MTYSDNAIPLIYDCDNTLGVPNKDVDDGLTLIYLLAQKNISLQGLTLTHGNADIEIVEEATQAMVHELNINTPLYSRDKAIEFLVDTVCGARRPVSVLATGSLTNIYKAAMCNSNFYRNIDTLYIMGGITKPLYVNGVLVNELNFSVDPKASEHVLNSEANICLLNGHVTSQAIFGQKELSHLCAQQGVLYRFLERSLKSWLARMKKEFDMDYFCNWDMAAAIYITHRHLFSKEKVYIMPTQDSLAIGDIQVQDFATQNSHHIHMPHTILDIDRFNNIILESFKEFQDMYIL